jgi:hypothetical protein
MLNHHKQRLIQHHVCLTPHVPMPYFKQVGLNRVADIPQFGFDFHGYTGATLSTWCAVLIWIITVAHITSLLC